MSEINETNSPVRHGCGCGGQGNGHGHRHNPAPEAAKSNTTTNSTPLDPSPENAAGHAGGAMCGCGRRRATSSSDIGVRPEGRPTLGLRAANS